MMRVCEQAEDNFKEKNEEESENQGEEEEEKRSLVHIFSLTPESCAAFALMDLTKGTW